MRALVLALFVSAPSLASAAPGPVAIAETEFEGRAHLKITTPAATYFYDRAGGAFSRLLDRDGRDWIAFRREADLAFPRSASAGYRGLPDLVAKTDATDPGAGRPGFDACASTIVGPAAIRTVSQSGRWAWTWSFAASHARLRMEKVPPKPPTGFSTKARSADAGRRPRTILAPTPAARAASSPRSSPQLIERWRWAYFGDTATPRVLFAAQVKADDLPDNLWYLGSESGGALASADGMIVFGFGRSRDGPQLRTPHEICDRFSRGCRCRCRWPRRRARDDSARRA